MRLAAYIRVSTEGQIDAYGKDIQRESIERWAELNDHEIVKWFDEDAVSGKIDGGERPVLSVLLSEADEFEGMVALDPSRLARRSVVQETLLALVWSTGLRVFTTTAGEMCDDDDPTRILIRQILAVVAEFDHRSIVKRLHNGRRHAMEAGRYGGGTLPYGLAVVGSGRSAQIVHDPVESRVVEEIVRRRSNNETLKSIADSLNRRVIPTKNGKEWTATQISRVVTRNQNT